MFTLPTLPYGYGDLGQSISKEIMELHHTKHHQTYVDKLNAALKDYPDLQAKTVEELIGNLDAVPDAIRTAVRNHGGGHYNHSLFWQCMSPTAKGQPEGALLEAIIQKYGSFQAFVDEFTTKALGLFGSGWVWLQPDLAIITTVNQDTPLMQSQPEPILGLDVWEHAYYLDYKNKRDDYVSAWWKVVDWDFVTERYAKATK